MRQGDLTEDREPPRPFPEITFAEQSIGPACRRCPRVLAMLSDEKIRGFRYFYFVVCRLLAAFRSIGNLTERTHF